MKAASSTVVVQTARPAWTMQVAQPASMQPAVIVGGSRLRSTSQQSHPGFRREVLSARAPLTHSVQKLQERGSPSPMPQAAYRRTPSVVPVAPVSVASVLHNRSVVALPLNSGPAVVQDLQAEEASMHQLRSSLLQHIQTVQQEISRLQQERQRVEEGHRGQPAAAAPAPAAQRVQNVQAKYVALSPQPLRPGQHPSQHILYSPQAAQRHVSRERERSQVVTVAHAAGRPAVQVDMIPKTGNSGLFGPGAPGAATHSSSQALTLSGTLSRAPAAAAEVRLETPTLRARLFQPTAGGATWMSRSAALPVATSMSATAPAGRAPALGTTAVAASAVAAAAAAASAAVAASSWVPLAVPVTNATGRQGPDLMTAVRSAAACRIQRAWRTRCARRRAVPVAVASSASAPAAKPAGRPGPPEVSRRRRTSDSAPGEGPATLPVGSSHSAAEPPGGAAAKPPAAGAVAQRSAAVLVAAAALVAGVPGRQPSKRPALHWAAGRIQRAWRIHRWHRTFVNFSEKECNWVGSLEWLQKQNMLYGTELADEDDVRWWCQHRSTAPLDREVDPWGSDRLLEHLHRMWYGWTPEQAAEQQRSQQREPQVQVQQSQGRHLSMEISSAVGQRQTAHVSQLQWTARQIPQGVRSGPVLGITTLRSPPMTVRQAPTAYRAVSASPRHEAARSLDATTAAAIASVPRLQRTSVGSLGAPPPPNSVYVKAAGPPRLGARQPDNVCVEATSYRAASSSPLQTTRQSRATIIGAGAGASALGAGAGAGAMSMVQLRPRSPLQTVRTHSAYGSFGLPTNGRLAAAAVAAGATGSGIGSVQALGMTAVSARPSAALLSSTGGANRSTGSPTAAARGPLIASARR